MTRELLLLRHGKSDWSVGAADFDRPLKDRGKRGAQRIGVWLAQQGLAPDLVVSSPAARALVTAEKPVKAMGSSSEGIRKDQRMYGVGLQDLLAVLAGHNPGLETLLAYLAGGNLKDPGFSPQASTAKEAWEEAGVEGKVGAEPIGSYVYDKWGATCTVEVYPMEVTRIVPEAEWEESHRGRQWVTPEQAIQRLKQADLGPLVGALAARLCDA